MFAGDVHEAVLLAQKLPQSPNGGPLRFVDVAMPLKRADGIPLGVLGAHLSWSWGEEIAASVLSVRADKSRVIEALIVSREGDVLLGPSDLRGKRLNLLSLGAARQGGARQDIETWPDGRDYLTATTMTTGYRDYPGLGWAVIIREDASTGTGSDPAFSADPGAGESLVPGWRRCLPGRCSPDGLPGRCWTSPRQPTASASTIMTPVFPTRGIMQRP